MLSIFEDGDGSFRLVDQEDVDVGWVRGNHLGFRGFGEQAEALAAALAGGDALAGHLERLTGAAVGTHAGTGRVRVRSDGEHEWIERGGDRVARLIRSGPDELSIEFVLPTYVKEGAVISASQVVHQAIVTQTTRAARPGAPHREAAVTGFPATT